MTALIAWLDASSEVQRRVQEIIKVFGERESRDELGVGQVRDALSDALWPGTSTLFTRAKYFLFVPWCYRTAAEKYPNIAAATKASDKNERHLIDALKAASTEVGVIGGNAGEDLANLPSALYWGGLRTHGIVADPTLSRDDAIVAEVERARIRRQPSSEPADEHELAWHEGAFHSTLPLAPAQFPEEAPGGFDLSRDEASWLRDRMLSNSRGTILEHALQQRPDAASAAPWEDSGLSVATGEARQVLDDARNFSTLMNGAALLYNLLLAEAYERERFDRVQNPVDTYRERLRAWAEQPGLDRDIATWDRGAFWARVHQQNPRINQRSRRFIDDWIDHLAAAPLAELAENERLRSFITNREREQKRGQARLQNKRLLQSWLGSAGSGRLIFRWNNVRTILHDIHNGLERDDA